MTSLLYFMNIPILSVGVQEILFIGVISIIPVVLILWALVDALSSQFVEKSNKLVWIAVILLLPILGAILYFVIGRNQRVLVRN